MFIELEDVGLEFDDASNYSPIRINANAPEHGRPILFCADNIVYAHPYKLNDGNVVTQICYSRGSESGLYWVKTSYGAVKTMLMQAKQLNDGNVVELKGRSVTSTMESADFLAAVGGKTNAF